MEVFGGFMVMLSIVGFFLTVIWFILPFVIFAIKGKVDRCEERLEAIERRLTVMEGDLRALARHPSPSPPTPAEVPADQESAPPPVE